MLFKVYSEWLEDCKRQVTGQKDGGDDGVAHSLNLRQTICEPFKIEQEGCSEIVTMNARLLLKTLVLFKYLSGLAQNSLINVNGEGRSQAQSIKPHLYKH